MVYLQGYRGAYRGGGVVGEVLGRGGGDCWCLYDFIQARSLRIRYFRIMTEEPHTYCLDKAIKKSIQKSILAIVLHKQNNF